MLGTNAMLPLYLACGLIAMTIAPRKIQIVVALAAIALMAYLPGRGQQSAALSVPSKVASAPRKAGTRFVDSKEAVAAVASACRPFDEHKADELSAALDDCMGEYMKVLARSGEQAAQAYTSHMVGRDAVFDRLREAYVVTGEEQAPEIDRANALVSAMFAACDEAMHMDGKADAPGPRPGS